MQTHIENSQFESPDHLLAWAREEIDKFELESTTFIRDDDPYVVVTEFNSESGLNELKLKQTKSPPIALRGHVGNIVKNLRDVLDQTTAIASRIVTGVESKNTHFPAGESPADLERSLSSKKPRIYKDIPVELHDAIRAIQPYPTGNGHAGGNDVLRTLIRVAGPHKHQLSIGLGMSMGGMGLQGRLAMGGISGSIGDFRWNSAKAEMILLTFAPGADSQVNIELTSHIAFDKGPLSGIPTLQFLDKAAGEVSIACWKIKAAINHLR